MLLYKDIVIQILLSITCLSSIGNDSKSIDSEHGFVSSVATNNTIVGDVNQGQSNRRNSITGSFAEECPVYFWNTSKQGFSFLKKINNSSFDLYNLTDQARELNLIAERENLRRLFDDVNQGQSNRRNSITGSFAEECPVYFWNNSKQGFSFLKKINNSSFDLYNLTDQARELNLIAERESLRLFAETSSINKNLTDGQSKLQEFFKGCINCIFNLNEVHQLLIIFAYVWAAIFKHYGIELRLSISTIRSKLFGKPARVPRKLRISFGETLGEDILTIPSEKFIVVQQDVACDKHVIVNATADLSRKTFVDTDDETSIDMKSSCDKHVIVKATADLSGKTSVDADKETRTSTKSSCDEHVIVSTSANFSGKISVDTDDETSTSTKSSCDKHLIVSASANFSEKTCVDTDDETSTSTESSCDEHVIVSATADFSGKTSVDTDDETSTDTESSCDENGDCDDEISYDESVNSRSKTMSSSCDSLLTDRTSGDLEVATFNSLPCTCGEHENTCYHHVTNPDELVDKSRDYQYAVDLTCDFPVGFGEDRFITNDDRFNKRTKSLPTFIRIPPSKLEVWETDCGKIGLLVDPKYFKDLFDLQNTSQESLSSDVGGTLSTGVKSGQGYSHRFSPVPKEITSCLSRSSDNLPATVQGHLDRHSDGYKQNETPDIILNYVYTSRLIYCYMMGQVVHHLGPNRRYRKKDSRIIDGNQTLDAKQKQRQRARRQVVVSAVFAGTFVLACNIAARLLK